MSHSRRNAAKGRFAPVLVSAAAMALAIPSAGFAFVGFDADGGVFGSEIVPFTPASVDPQLARRVAEQVAAKGHALRFTPAGTGEARDRTVTVAVRVDDETARAISVRSAIAAASGEAGRGTASLAPTRYDLGVARGYKSFAKATPKLPSGIRDVEMPDLASYEPSNGSAPDKPGRLQPRISLEQDRSTIGRSRGTLEALGEQTVDLGGSYRVSRNLDVTAGVRLSQDRDRLAPLTNGVEDSQAVYVGTQFRF